MRIVLALASVLLLAGCGGSPQSYTSAQDLAKDMSCTSYRHGLPPYDEQGMTDLAQCWFSDHHFVLKVYRSNAAMQDQLSLLSAPYMYAANWVVLCDTQTSCDIEDSMGGTLVKG